MTRYTNLDDFLAQHELSSLAEAFRLRRISLDDATTLLCGIPMVRDGNKLGMGLTVGFQAH